MYFFHPVVENASAVGIKERLSSGELSLNVEFRGSGDVSVRTF